MGPLVGYWRVVELDVVPGTMDLDCCCQPISGSLGSAPRAGRVDPLLLWAKPVVLMTSYLTKDFVEEQENGCPIGQLYIQMYAVRGR